MLLLVALGMVGCASAPQPEVASKIEDFHDGARD